MKFGDILSFVGDVAGANKAAGAQKDANAVNREIAELNADLQRELLDEQLAYAREINEYQRQQAERILGIQLEGQTDALGNKVGYVEGEGFVTQLNPIAQALAGLQQDTSLQQTRNFAQQSPLVNALIEDNNLRRGREGAASDAFLSQLTGPSPYNVDTIRSNLRTAARQGVNEQFGDLENAIIRQSLRSGSGASSALAEIGKQRGSTLAQALTNAEIQAPAQAEDLNNSRTNRLSGLVRALSGLGAGITNPAATGGNTLADALSSAGSTTSNLLANTGNLFRGQQSFNPATVPQVNYSQPVSNSASVFGSIQDSATNLFESLDNEFGISNAIGFGNRSKANQVASKS